LLLKDLCVRMGSGHLVDAREQGKLGVDLDSHDSGLLLIAQIITTRTQIPKGKWKLALTYFI
jgi:hypothetical protein